MSDNPYQSSSVTDFSSDSGVSDSALDTAVSTLRQTSPWVRFISVLMFIASGFMILSGIIMLVIGLFGAATGVGTGGMNSAFMPFFGGLYLVMAFLYVMPALYLWRYANRIGVLQQQKSVANLASALEPQKSFWRFVGILMIVFMIGYPVILFVAFLIMPVLARFN